MNTTGLVIPGVTDPSKLTCIARATRKYGQYLRAIENALDGHCPFCKIDRAVNQVIFEINGWITWRCTPPERNTRLHFLIVSRRHVTMLHHLNQCEKMELMEMVETLERKYELTSNGILIRNNAIELAGTIEHLHIHLMVPDGTGRVESPFYKGPEDEAESLKRAIVFEKIRQGASTEGLAPAEWELVKDRLND